jgi:two-component system, NarL family, nitrate/nitrite response regulator NarL
MYPPPRAGANAGQATMLVVDGCEAMRKTLSRSLAELGDVSMQRASDVSSALALITAGTPVDLVLLDITTSGIDGFAALAALRKLFPELKIALVCGSTEAGEVRRAADLGAVGYLPKAMARVSLIHAIRLILSGERFFPAQFLRAAAMSGPSSVRRGGLSKEWVEPDTIGLTSRHFVGPASTAETPFSRTWRANLANVSVSGLPGHTIGLRRARTRKHLRGD